MKLSNKDDLVIVYTIESGDSKQVKLPVQVEDVYTNGVIDRKKVSILAASNEAKNNRAILSPFVIDLKGNII